ncbi:MAG: hypothetical protein JNM56_19690 [Planctomycetia bacterium]|nr:hypothetical protein [Planctomycetia bacterium]
MDSKPEVIRQQMEETRTALTQKLESLEEKVVSTVQGATSAVTDTVENVKEAVEETVTTVKDTVQDTVETVRDSLDVEQHVQRRPWLMFGGSVLLGFVAGQLLHSGSRRRYRPRGERPLSGSTPAMSVSTPAAAAAASAATLPEEPGLLSSLAEQFQPEIAKLKGLAIGTALGAVRDIARELAPDQMKAQVADMVNNVTVKLGGEPIQGSVLDAHALFQQDSGEVVRRDVERPRAAVYR